MAKFCITTVSTANAYQYFVPMFIYSTKRAYPDAHVKVFVLGKLHADIRALLHEMKDLHMVDTGWEVIENALSKYPVRWNTPNAIRFLIHEKAFKGFKYVFITDADFLYFEHKPSLLSYYRSIMKRSKTPYAGCRSSVTKPYRKSISAAGWKGDFQRIVGGGVLLRNPDWFKACGKQLDKYRKLLIAGKPDKIDMHRAGSYREYDEVMLYRICSLSGLSTPKRKYVFLDGSAYKMAYRDIHLGDFKFSKRRSSVVRMRRLLKKEAIVNYMIMKKEPGWQKVVQVCRRAKAVNVAIHMLHSHITKRKKEWSTLLSAAETARGTSGAASKA